MKKIFMLILLCCFSGAMLGQSIDTDSQDSDSKWNFDVAPYLWFSSLKGDISFLDRSIPVEAEFKDILDQLSFGVLIHAEANKGSWTIITDLIYMKLKEDGTLRNTSQSLSSEIEQIIWELGGAYRIIKLEDYFILDGKFGIRYFGLKPTLAINQRTVFDKSLDFVDPYVGIRFKSVNGKWLNRAGFDVGGFGIGSQLSWKLNLFVGYQINRTLALYLGYQAYDVNYEENDASFNYDVVTGGFLSGLNINF